MNVVAGTPTAGSSGTSGAAVGAFTTRERLLAAARELIEEQGYGSASLQAAIDATEIPQQDVAFTAAALVGGCAEVLVGPLSPLAGSSQPGADELVASIRTFVRRAIGEA